MTGKNRIFIVARYNENLDWLSYFNESVIIYNKSNTFEYGYPRHDVPNFGRETETFIRAIIQYYNQLDDFESMVFLQGNPFEHCKSLSDLLNKLPKNTFEYLSDKKAKTSFPTSEYFNMHLSTMCRMFDIQYDWDIEKFYNSENESKNTLLNLKHYEDCISLCHYLGIKTENINYEWACGCQYQVPISMIKNKPLQWWLDIHNMHTYFSRSLKLDFFSYVLETIWPLLIKFQPKGDLEKIR